MRDNSAMTNCPPNAFASRPCLQPSSSARALGEAFFVATPTATLPDPYWVGRSVALAQELGLFGVAEGDPAWLQLLSGNRPVHEVAPLAGVYSGHQFGVWAGQLGDGRAHLLGEVADQEVQLKGAGLTPFSRMGDGRAVLRSSIREFLCSQAMHALGIPTTRALCVTGSDLGVQRETLETAAVVTRVAPSFIRFGHFEHFCHHDQHAQLRQLADFVIARFYPDCLAAAPSTGNAYARLLHAVTERTAQMVAQWQAVGFCHGVMNTDNMSVLGLTIDYGPFQFLDSFDPAHICNHSDHQGRYSFQNQPRAAHWNLHCLAQALLPLIEDVEQARTALESFQPCHDAAYARCMAAKLGFAQASDATTTLAEEVLGLLAAQRVDYTIFWRRLSHWSKSSDPHGASVRDLFLQSADIAPWLVRYAELSAHHPQAHSSSLMLQTNPKYVLRNHLGELAIRAARNKDFSVVAQLLAVLERPFDEHPAHEHWADFAPAWASTISISCSS